MRVLGLLMTPSPLWRTNEKKMDFYPSLFRFYIIQFPLGFIYKLSADMLWCQFQYNCGSCFGLNFPRNPLFVLGEFQGKHSRDGFYGIHIANDFHSAVNDDTLEVEPPFTFYGFNIAQYTERHLVVLFYGFFFVTVIAAVKIDFAGFSIIEMVQRSSIRILVVSQNRKVPPLSRQTCILHFASYVYIILCDFLHNPS